MRKLFLAASLGMAVPFAFADEPKKPDETPKKVVPKIAPRPAVQQPKREATLKIGDAAPKLAADKWLQGNPVKSFAAGKTYVVEFWATWCGPCIVMMPHMAEMQAEYKDKGVTFIGFSAKDPNNTEEKVTEFVKKRGPKLGYTFAYADDREVYSNWMTAAAQSGIPCSFVVNGEGKIAWVGHPMYLDFVLPKVVAGKFGEEEIKAVDELKQEVSAIFKASSGTDHEAYLKLFNDLLAKHAWAKNIPYFVMPRITKLALAKKYDEACLAAREALSKATHQEDTALIRNISFALRADNMKSNADLLAISVQAAEALLKIQGENDAMALDNAAQTYLAAGDQKKSAAFATKAVDAAKTAMESTTLLRSPVFKDDKEMTAKILANTEKQLGTESNITYSTYLTVAEAFFAQGNKAKAKTYGEKAVTAAPATIKAAIEKRVSKYSEEN